MKRLLYLFGMVTIFSACDAIETPPGETNVFIGVALPQTGTLHRSGQSIMNGIHLAIQEHGELENVNLSLILEDTRSTAAGADVAFQKLAQIDHLAAILGPLSSTATQAVIPVIQEHQITSIGPTSAKTGLSVESNYLFRSSLTVDRLIPAGVRTAKSNLGFTNVATLHNSGDAFSISSHEHVTEELQSHNDITIAIATSYFRAPGTPLREADIAGELEKILSFEPPVDAIFLSGLPEDHLTILPAAHKMDNPAPFVIPLLSIAEVHAIHEAAPGAAEGAVTLHLWVSGSPNSMSQQFVRSYMNNFGNIPDDWAARGYVSMVLLTEAVRRSSVYDSDTIREALSGIQDFPTIFGRFSFNDDGDAVYDQIVAVVEGNDFVTWPIVD